jgi:hypothetical protein
MFFGSGVAWASRYSHEDYFGAIDAGIDSRPLG